MIKIQKNNAMHNDIIDISKDNNNMHSIIIKILFNNVSFNIFEPHKLLNEEYKVILHFDANEKFLI